MVRREDLEALADTVEILSNPTTMQLIRKSDEDIQRGRVKEISSVDDLLRECSWCPGSSGEQIRFLRASVGSGIIQKSFLTLQKRSNAFRQIPCMWAAGCQDRFMGKNLHGLQNNIVWFFFQMSRNISFISSWLSIVNTCTNDIIVSWCSRNGVNRRNPFFSWGLGLNSFFGQQTIFLFSRKTDSCWGEQNPSIPIFLRRDRCGWP